MKTKTVRVDELEGEALKHIHSSLMRFGHIGPASAATVKKIAQAVCGPTVEVPAELAEGEQEPTECPSCHHTVITDDFVYVCQQCGAETCPDCAGRCGCELVEVSDE